MSVTRLLLFPSHDKNKFGRVANYLSFALSSLLYGLFFARRPDVIYAYHPPLTVGISAGIINFFRRVPIVLDIQDMWPDTLKATGMITNSLILGLVSRICNLIYSSASKIVVLSPGFKSLLVARGVPERKINVIYNWADEEVLRKSNGKLPKEFKSVEGFKVLFAGNIGQAQGLDVILDAAFLLKDSVPEIQFFILGEGLQRNSLKTKADSLNLKNVHFLKAVNMEKVGIFLDSVDALLIHLNSDPLFEITIPGKSQAYMAVGKPIIMGVKGDASNLISRANCGVCFEPENSENLAEVVSNLMNLSSEEIKELGENSRKFYDKNLSVKVGINSFSKIFTEVINNSNN